MNIERVPVSSINWALRENKERMLTTPIAVNETITTTNGDMPYLDWCEMEAKRIAKAPGRTTRVNILPASLSCREIRCCVVGNYYEPDKYQKQ